MVKVLKKVKYGLNSGFRHGFKNVIFSKFFFGFITSLSVLISSHDKAGRIKDYLDAKFNEQEDTFDFIIVGGGSAGSLLANRLSEGHKVLLLEAGGEPHPLQRIPGMALFMLNHAEIDWMHRTVPQRRACFSSPRRRASWSQGLNLGGSSNLNFMMHLRGSPRDFDHWAKVTGDDSWSYEALLPYFRRHENYQGDSPDREAHGFDGELKLEVPSYTGMAKEFIRAGQELGYEHVDLNARYDEGFDTIFYPLDGGERRTAFSCFLEPCRHRETLVIRKYAHVNKLLIRGYDTTAYGVEYFRHGRLRYAYATKEIILSAGTVESAKLLMLSGIGPKTHLADLGIPIVADLPVGKNLQDHLATFLGPFFIDPPRSYLIDRDITLKSFYEYKSDGNGPMSSSLFQAAAMISSKKNKWAGTWNWPDIQLLFSGLASHKTFAKDLSHAFHLNSKPIRKYTDTALGRDSFFIAVTPSRPFARGEIVLEKRDPFHPVSINPHYLENDHDVGIMIEGIKTALYLVENTTSFQDLRARFTSKKFPGCEHMAFRSDEYFECYIRHFSLSLSDPVGSCAMGHPHMGRDGVLDSELQVIGVNHLRVVDASVMPTIPGAPVEAAVFMIAEKGADIIIEAWRTRGEDEKHNHHEHHRHQDNHNRDEDDHHHNEHDYDGPPDNKQFVPHNLKDNFGGHNFHPGDNDGPGSRWNNGNGPPPQYNGPPSSDHHGPNNGPPHGPNDGPPHGPNNGPPYGPNDGPPHGPNNGPPYGPNDGPPHGSNDGPPHGPNNGPPYGPNDGPPHGPNNGPPYGPNDGPPHGPNNGPPYGPNDGPPHGPNDGPPHGQNNGRPPGLNNGPPSFRPYWPPSTSDLPPIFNSSFMMNPVPPENTSNGPPPAFNHNDGPRPNRPPLNNVSPTNQPFNNGPQNNSPQRGRFNYSSGQPDMNSLISPSPNGPFNNDGPPANGRPFNNGPPPSGPFNNGLPNNGPPNNGPPPNGSFNNGPSPSGPFNNGPPPNGPFINGPSPNGPFNNGPPPNGPFNNGPPNNGPPPNGSFNNNDNDDLPHAGPLPPPNTMFSLSSPPSFFNPNNNPTNTPLISSARTPHSTTSGNSAAITQITSLVPGIGNSPVSGGVLVLDHPDPTTLNLSTSLPSFANSFDFTHATAKPSRFDMDMESTTTTEATTNFFSATRPQLINNDVDTKIRPGLQISNPFPDEAYKQEQEDFKSRYPITSSVEYFNNVPYIPGLSFPNFGPRPQDQVQQPQFNQFHKGTMKPTKGIPSSASVPDIYYKIKDGSSLNNLAIDEQDLKKQQENDSSTSNSNINQVQAKVPATKSPYWINHISPISAYTTTPTPNPYYVNASPLDVEDPTSTTTTTTTTLAAWTPLKSKPGKITVLKSLPGKVIRIKSGNVGVSFSTTSSPSQLEDRQEGAQNKNKIKIRIKHKNMPLQPNDNHQNIQPYFSQTQDQSASASSSSSSSRTLITIKKSKNSKPFKNLRSPVTITPRPLLSVTIWPDEHNNNDTANFENLEHFKDFSYKNASDSQPSSTMFLSALAESTMDVLQGRDPEKVYDEDGKELKQHLQDIEPDSMSSFSIRHENLPQILTTIQPPSREKPSTSFSILENPTEFMGTDHTFVRPPFHIDQNSERPLPHPLPFGKFISRPPWTPSRLLKLTTPNPTEDLHPNPNYRPSVPGFSNLIRDRYNYQMISGTGYKAPPDPVRFPTSFHELSKNMPANNDSTSDMSAASYTYHDDKRDHFGSSTTLKSYPNHGTGLPRPTTTHKPVMLREIQNDNVHSQSQQNLGPPPDFRKQFTSFYKTQRQPSFGRSFGAETNNAGILFTTTETPISLINNYHQSPGQLISHIMGQDYGQVGISNHDERSTGNEQRYPNFLDTFNTPGDLQNSKKAGNDVQNIQLQEQQQQHQQYKGVQISGNGESIIQNVGIGQHVSLNMDPFVQNTKHKAAENDLNFYINKHQHNFENLKVINHFENERQTQHISENPVQNQNNLQNFDQSPPFTPINIIDNQRKFTAGAPPTQQNLEQNFNNFQKNQQNIQNFNNGNSNGQIDQQLNFYKHHENQQNRPVSNFDYAQTPPEENFDLHPENLQTQTLNFQSPTSSSDNGRDKNPQNYHNANSNQNQYTRNENKHVFVFGENSALPQQLTNQNNFGEHTGERDPIILQPPNPPQFDGNSTNSIFRNHNAQSFDNVRQHFDNFRQNVNNVRQNAGHSQDNFGQNAGQSENFKQHVGENENKVRQSENSFKQNAEQNHNNIRENAGQIEGNFGQNAGQNENNFKQNTRQIENNFKQSGAQHENNFRQDAGQNQNHFRQNSGQGENTNIKYNSADQYANKFESNINNFGHNTVGQTAINVASNVRQYNDDSGQKVGHHNVANLNFGTNTGTQNPNDSNDTFRPYYGPVIVNSSSFEQSNVTPPMVQSGYVLEHHTTTELTTPIIEQIPDAVQKLSRPDFLSDADPSPQYDDFPSPTLGSVDVGQVSLTYDDSGSTSAFDQPVISNGDIIQPITNSNGTNNTNVDIEQVMLTNEPDFYQDAQSVPNDFHQNPPYVQEVSPDDVLNFHQTSQNVPHEFNNNTQYHQQDLHQNIPHHVKEIISTVIIDPHPFDGLLTPTGTPTFSTTPTPPFVTTSNNFLTPYTSKPQIFGRRIPIKKNRDPFSNFGDTFTTTLTQDPTIYDHHYVQDLHHNFDFTVTTPFPTNDFTSSSSFEPFVSGPTTPITRQFTATPDPNQEGNVIDFNHHSPTQQPHTNEFQFPSPLPSPRPGPREYTIYSNPDTVDITQEPDTQGNDANTNFQYRKGMTEEADIEMSTTEKSIAHGERLHKSTHLRRRADILQRRRKRRRNFFRSGGRRFDDDQDDDYDNPQTEPPFRRRNRRPHSRRRFKDEIENYPFRKRSSAEDNFEGVEAENSTMVHESNSSNFSDESFSNRSNTTTTLNDRARKMRTPTSHVDDSNENDRNATTT